MTATLLALAILLTGSTETEARPLGDSGDSTGAPVAFVHVRLVPMDAERVVTDQTVLVEDGRISRVGPSATVEVPEGAQVIDGDDELYLMPGLCDSHVHVLEPDEFALYLANGVTTVRNMSGEPFHLVWRREIAGGRMLAPTLLTAGPTLDGVPPEGTNRILVTTREAGEQSVEFVAASGYDFVKVYSGLSVEAFSGIASAARSLRIPVVGHLARAVGLADSLARGQASIDHAEEYLYTFFASAGPERIPEAVRLTREAGASVTPNLVAYETIGLQVAGTSELAARPEQRFVDPAVQRLWLGRGNHYLRDFSPDDAQWLRERLAFLRELVRALHEAGVPLLAGTDAGIAFGVAFVLPGSSLHRELALLVSCGLSPYEALRTATVVPAAFVGDEGAGTIAEGSPGDLVLLRGNPLEDVANAARIAGVMVRGEWLSDTELSALVEALPKLYADEAAFLEGLRQDGVLRATERFRETRTADPNARLFRESKLNAVGYELLDAGRTSDALAVFELNVEAYPASPDVYDSLGEALMRDGITEGAIESYEKALALNPWNANAAAALEELRSRR